MNKRIVFLAGVSFCCLGLSASLYADDIEVNTARMQAMDKITGKVTEIDVPVGGLVNYGSFSILARKCVTRTPEETPENTAFIDVVDNYLSDNPVNIFKGWMFSSSPALNAVEHPIYDVWLLQCYNNTKQDKTLLLNEEQLLMRDSLPMKRDNKTKTITGPINLSETIQKTTSDTPAYENYGNETTEESALKDDDFVSEGEEVWQPDILINDISIANDVLGEETSNTQNNSL